MHAKFSDMQHFSQTSSVNFNARSDKYSDTSIIGQIGGADTEISDTLRSVSELKERFVWFFKTYPEYDWDLVLDAADDYTKLFKMKNYQYMATSSYFIKKMNSQKEVTSKLADYCQQILDELKILNNQ